MPPPGFAEIAQSLCGDNPLRVVSGIPPELAKDQGPVQMVGSSMLSTLLFMDASSGAMCIDMVTCLMNLVGMEYVPQQKTAMLPPT